VHRGGAVSARRTADRASEAMLSELCSYENSFVPQFL
jgi:hypothetical protein